MEIIKIINKSNKYVAKNGKEYTQTNYYVKLENGEYVAIKPSFAKGYTQLDTIAKVIYND